MDSGLRAAAGVDVCTDDLETDVEETRNSVYWHDTEPVEVGEPLDGDASCDICIVGAGYTGLWAAHFLAEAEPSADIRVLEAEAVGSGASSANGGFVGLTAGKVLRRLLWYYGREKAAGVYRTGARSIIDIGRFCRQYGIDADFAMNGMLQVVTDRKQLARLELQVKRSERTGLRGSFKLLGRDEAQQRIGSEQVLGALRTTGALVNPHRLAQGLARVVREQGVSIHERTPVIEVRKVGNRYRVTTPTGTVTANEVVLATNAWQHSFAQTHTKVMPVWNYLMVTEPLTDAQLARVAWPGREGVSNSLSFAHAARLTADNRVVWSGGRWYYFDQRDTDRGHIRNDAAYRDLRESFVRFFPAWRDVRFSHAFGGPIGWSRTFIPQFGRTGDGLVYGHGYTGNGIAPSHTGGKILRDLVLRRDTEYTELAFVTVNQPKFAKGAMGDKGAHLFIWRQETGDRLPLLLPHSAALAPRAFFAARAARRARMAGADR
ncbi:FAD-binding oxidoreductase [Micromonospora sp. NPDC051296]|uniref:NAD(P)/FAD-dependent oxidoreductase n=1 Tax=Micromonospora sp. NPDC051296 TaxID=3155046 RepID=UPI003414AAEB